MGDRGEGVDPMSETYDEAFFVRMRDCLADHFGWFGMEEKSTIPQMIAAFKAAKQPEEPQGLGAVVEDADGHLWIRHGAGPSAWMFAGASPSSRDTYHYDEIEPVRVLSEGVPS
jgi:hypothetical protein